MVSATSRTVEFPFPVAVAAGVAGRNDEEEDDSVPNNASSTGAGVTMEEISQIFDVTKSNFLEQSNDFIARVPKASWIAIDEEMTGIQLPTGNKISKDETPSTRYAHLKQVSERYSIIQLGICLFQELEEEEKKFHVYRYKFTLFPPSDSNTTREVVLSPSSVKFLAEENNCNLNEWIQEGIPFCTEEKALQSLNDFRQQELDKQQKENNSTTTTTTTTSSTSPNPNRRRVELTRTEDRDFHARAMASLREWLDAAVVVPSSSSMTSNSEGASFVLPPCNSFLRRALYESIPLEYPNLILETMPNNSQQIRIWRLNTQERVQRKERLLREGFEKVLGQQVGAYRVFLALTLACQGRGPQSQAEKMALASNVKEAFQEEDWIAPSTTRTTNVRPKIPLIVHNGLQDLCFLMTHFHNPILPEKWSDLKNTIHSYFPVIYDTKVLAKDYCHRDVFRGRTHLAAVYDYTIPGHPIWKERVFTGGSGNVESQMHDAGYDSYCTGAAFYGLATQIHHQLEQTPVKTEPPTLFPLWNCTDESDDEIRWEYGRNKLYFHLSPYTIDLERHDNGDPLTRGMELCSTFRIDNIDPSVTTRDIVRCLSNLYDASGQRVNYEIVWIHDTCFMVGAMLQQRQQSRDLRVYQEHGQILWTALQSRFGKSTITVLNNDNNELDRHEHESTISEDGNHTIWNLWGLLGSGKRKKNRDDDAINATMNSPPSKRRRFIE